MSIATEIQRIQGAKSDLAVSITNKGVTVPATTKIDGYAALVDQIQQGGGTENEFLTETDISYMFDYRNSTDDKIIAGIQRFTQNQLTTLNHCFYYFNDNRFETVPADMTKCIGLIKQLIENNESAAMSYLLSYFTFPKDGYTAVLDLSGIELTDDCDYMFEHIGSRVTSDGTSSLIIKCDKNTFKQATSAMYLFAYTNRSVSLQLIDDELDFTTMNFGHLFDSANRLTFLDMQGNELKEISIDFSESSSNTSLANIFTGCTQLERIHIKSNNKITNLNGAFFGCFNLKSIDGLDFSKINSTSNYNLFNTSGSTYFDELGEVGIVSGCTLGDRTSANLNLSRIWHATADTVRDGQTIGYWYEKFANALENKAISGTQTITINTTLYNSLTQAQKELITNKGYVLASAS